RQAERGDRGYGHGVDSSSSFRGNGKNGEPGASAPGFFNRLRGADAPGSPRTLIFSCGSIMHHKGTRTQSKTTASAADNSRRAAAASVLGSLLDLPCLSFFVSLWCIIWAKRGSASES